MSSPLTSRSPAGTSQSRWCTGCRYWRMSTTRPTSSRATTPTAPLFSTTSRVATPPPDMVTLSEYTVKIGPRYRSMRSKVSCSKVLMPPLRFARSRGGDRFGLRAPRLRGRPHRQFVGGGLHDGGGDERGEQGVRPGRAALEFRVCLGGHEERVGLAV